MDAERGPGVRLVTQIRPISAEDTRKLRHRILRPSQPIDATVYPGDDLADTAHLGAFEGDRLVGIASLYREDRAGGPSGGWRLRGMATDADVQGVGHGAAVLASCVEHAAAEGGAELWCNARIPAVGFYRRAGFEVVSEEFDVAGIGPHVVMVRATPA
ncbi:MAG: GNAT family N-acetyltransferase [Acidimicrobiales bacterium]